MLNFGFLWRLFVRCLHVAARPVEERESMTIVEMDGQPDVLVAIDFGTTYTGMRDLFQTH